MTKKPNLSPSETTSHETPIRRPNGVSRRSLMLALPLTGTVGAVPGLAQAGETNMPVLQAYREWRAEFDHIESNSMAMTDEDFNLALDDLGKIADRLFALECRSASDVLAKFVVLCDDGEELVDDGGRWSAHILAEAKAVLTEAQA